MSKAKLKKALVEYYEGYCLSIDAEEMLNTKVKFGGEFTTIAKIARNENFSAEETAALCAGIENFNINDVINAIKNRGYEFHADARDFSELGETLLFQLAEDNVIPDWIFPCVDVEKLGCQHFTNANGKFSDYGYFEVF